MTEIERSLARLESVLIRAHQIESELLVFGKCAYGSDERMERKSLARERKFLLREARRLVSQLMFTDETKRLVENTVSSAKRQADSGIRDVAGTVSVG